MLRDPPNGLSGRGHLTSVATANYWFQRNSYNQKPPFLMAIAKLPYKGDDYICCCGHYPGRDGSAGGALSDIYRATAGQTAGASRGVSHPQDAARAFERLSAVDVTMAGRPF